MELMQILKENRVLGQMERWMIRKERRRAMDSRILSIGDEL